ncbi:MAG: hypothetical protein WBJ84_02125 [Bacteroidales bacterium]
MNVQSPAKSIPIKPLWMKAAVAGGLWASVEIIVGSFLHNIRVPFAGAVLASFGVMLMIAFYRMWPERGLIWRAGVICALMKSVSPSVNILGPMLSITIEAFLLDITLRLMGKNLISFMVAGGITVMSAFAIKIFNILVVFGLNMVTLYENVFNAAAKQLGFENPEPLSLILAIAGIYFLAGMIAAIIGFTIGQRYIKEPPGNERAMALTMHNTDTESGHSRHSIWLLFLHLMFIPAGILVLNKMSLFYALPLVVVYLVFCIVWYPNIWRRISKPFLWVQLLIMILLAGLFYGGSDIDNGSNHYQSWLAGLQMLFRAMLVITAFSGISNELRNPWIRKYLTQGRFKQIYSAVSLAFMALPAMLEENVKPRELVFRPFSVIAAMLANAGNWVKTFEQNENNMMTVEKP